MTRLESPERVLSTLEQDGSRRWLKPRLSHGAFLNYRRKVGYALIAIFIVIPFISIKGKPAMLLDVVNRQFTLLGYTFLPTDTVLLALFILGLFVAVFLATALFGRVWCGWACPQTVYLEFVFRPIERYFDRTKEEGRVQRMIVKYVLYFLISLAMAHVFLAYFVGIENLFKWVRQSPLEHPASFLIVAATTGLIMFDFCYFREQTCILACPYGRLQSVLLDRHSLIVSYDRERGEPRGKLRRRPRPDDNTPERGDCVNCGLCVMTCPTGIDIRDGLQMECIGCAQCVDACNRVMTKIKKPTGLIRYSSQATMDHEAKRLIRPRVIIYPAIVAIVAVAFLVTLSQKKTADVTVMRNLGNPYTVLDGDRIANGIRIKITNRGKSDANYQIAPVNHPDAQISLADGIIAVAAGTSRTEGAQIIVPRSAFVDGAFEAAIRVSDGSMFDQTITYRLHGPYSSAAAPEEPR